MPLTERTGHKKWFLQYADKLDELFEGLMNELNATKKDELYTWSIQTKAGELGLTCWGDWIATKFEKPSVAKHMLGLDCNPFSGKWNFHTNWVAAPTYKQADAPQVFFAEFEKRLRAIL